MAEAQTVTHLELPQKLALAQLERHLWGAADILRGKIDSSYYKHYIFGLLFFKRLSDVWEEEYEQRLAEYHDSELAADPDEQCVQPAVGMSVHDSACGSGGFLLQAVEYLKDHGKNWKSLSLWGQEINLNTWAICEMNLFLHDVDDAVILCGDTLRNPRHLVAEGSKTPRTFDRVLANPPFSLKSWGHELWSKGDAFRRDKYGCPPKSYGDLAFVQHMVASLKPEGMLGVVLPHGILFRGGAEGKIRKGMLQDDLIDAVIGLAPKLFYGTGIPAYILIVRKSKPEEGRGKVLFVNGEKEYLEGKNQNSLNDENVPHLAEAFLAHEDKERFGRVVSLEEIEKNDWNLRGPRGPEDGRAQLPLR